MNQIMLTIDRLALDPRNARKLRDKDSLESLKASILEHGIIQPIGVRPLDPADTDLAGNIYRVFAGGRRLLAISRLIEEKKLSPDFPIPALIRDVNDDAADEMSLAENILRRAMRPVDEFRAFSRLAEAGVTAEEIALRFGQTVRFVQGRMALGKLHPDILDALEREEIGLEAAMAYTIEPDQDRQSFVFDTLQGWQKGNARAIKQMFTGDGQRAESHLAKFIGEERYTAAGGKISADLFSNEVYWTSAEVIKKLKAERIEEIRTELLADGWSFVSTVEELLCNRWEVRRLSPEGSTLSAEDIERMDELTNALEEYAGQDEDDLSEDDLDDHRRLTEEYEALERRAAAFTAGQKAVAGVLIRTDHTYAAELGVVLPGAKAEASSGSEKKAADPMKIPAPVLEAMGDAATAALAEAIASKPDLALAFLAAVIEMGDDNTLGKGRPSRLKVERIGYGQKLGDARTFEDAFKHYAGMGPDQLKAELAELAAKSADLTEKWFTQHWLEEAKRPAARRAALDALGASVLPHFDPDGFFAGVKKPFIAAAYKEMTGEELKDDKKADMAKAAAEAARKTGWLPKELRTASYRFVNPTAPDEPAAKKPARSKKK